MPEPAPKRRWLRFSLRSLILFVALASSGYGLWHNRAPWRRGPVLKGHSDAVWSAAFSLDGKPCARGSVTAACCLRDHDRKLAAVEIPPFISGRIEQAPDSEPTEQP